MKKKVMYSLFLVLFSLFLLAGCKKNVGTSEDNAVVDEENQNRKKYLMIIPLDLLVSICRIRIMIHWKSLSRRNWRKWDAL